MLVIEKALKLLHHIEYLHVLNHIMQLTRPIAIIKQNAVVKKQTQDEAFGTP